MDKNKPFSVIFLAGGIGARMGADIPKQYLKLQNKPVALHSFDIFYCIEEVKEIVVVCDEKYQTIFKDYDSSRIRFAPSGYRRQDSLYNGIEALRETDPLDLVCIHDSARPLIDVELVRRVVNMADQWEAAVAGVQVKSTIKLCDASQLVINTLDRSHLWEIQTPQVIRFNLLQEGIKLALDLNLSVTDDVSLIELLGKPVKVVEGSYANIKITTPEDIILINQLIERNVLLQTQDCV